MFLNKTSKQNCVATEAFPAGTKIPEMWNNVFNALSVKFPLMFSSYLSDAKTRDLMFFLIPCGLKQNGNL